ncbi:MAG: FAD-dependent oxidoreductase [bacterium]
MGRSQGLRDRVEITFATPLPGAFTKPRASKYLGNFLQNKGIDLVPEFSIERVDAGANKIITYDEKEIEYDLLVTIPTNMGDELIERSDMGDELNFIPTDRQTLQAKNYENVFVIGDATDLPSSKAGSVAHFQSEILYENILRANESLGQNDVPVGLLEFVAERFGTPH